MPAVKCSRCGEEMKDGRCPGCGAWTDSYGLVHVEGCQGGFHEECLVESRPKGKKKS